MEWAQAHGHAGPVRVAGISTVSPTYPDPVIDLPYLAADSTAGTPAPTVGFKESIGARAYAEAGLGPDDMDVAEVYDLSSAMELDWYEQLGFCAPGEAERLLRDGDTAIGGRLPVNPSGGLGAFGEAVPAQAIAQVCELTWQLRGTAGLRPGGRRQSGHHCQPGPIRPRLLSNPPPLSGSLARPRPAALYRGIHRQSGEPPV